MSRRREHATVMNRFLSFLPRVTASATLLTMLTAGALRAHGITHVNLPTSSHGPEQQTVDALKQLLVQHREDRVLIHDSTGYRTAMIWAAYRVDAGIDPTAAIEEVRGFANDPGLAQAIQRYAELRSAM